MYGLISPGSKTLTADIIHAALPQAACLVDIMAGGCAISHCAIGKNKFQRIITNDVDNMRIDLFTMAVRGELRSENRWISRDDFNMLRDSDPYAWYCWSANNEGRSYIYKQRPEEVYGKVFRTITAASEVDRWQSMRSLIDSINQLTMDIRIEDRLYSDIESVTREEADMVKIADMSGIIDYFIDAAEGAKLQKSFIKRLMGTSSVDHYFRRSAQWCMPSEEQYEKLQMMLPRLTRTYRELRNDYERAKTQYDYMVKGKTANEKLLMNLGNIEPFNTLDNLRAMEVTRTRAESLTTMHLDYARVPLPDDCVVFADPPHMGDAVAKGDYPFDFQRFYSWCESQQVPVVISEYSMPKDRFRRIAELRTDAEARTEYLWMPINQKYYHYKQQTIF